MSVVVRGQALTKRFAAQLAVAGLDLTVDQGECFGLLGPNGAGKTTTLRMVYGVNQPTSGRIQVFGLDVATHGRAVRSRLGVTLQENVLIDALSAVDNLRVFGRFHLIPEAELTRRIERLAERFELGSHAQLPSIALSGGFKRRLAIAMSLINEPELLILDEPTTGLDPAVRLSLWNQVRELRSEGKTVLLTTHYMDEAERLCDRVMIMSAGKAVCEGPPRQLVESHLAREVLEFDCSEAEERALLAAVGPHKTLRSGVRLFVFAAEAAPRVVQLRKLDGGAKRPFVARPANLEDLFLATTGTKMDAEVSQ